MESCGRQQEITRKKRHNSGRKRDRIIIDLVELGEDMVAQARR
jgi:hypothetical protein